MTCFFAGRRVAQDYRIFRIDRNKDWTGFSGLRKLSYKYCE